jgi:3',5'-cyclic AMP phosphodiesterase CpdA
MPHFYADSFLTPRGFPRAGLSVLITLAIIAYSLPGSSHPDWPPQPLDPNGRIEQDPDVFRPGFGTGQSASLPKAATTLTIVRGPYLQSGAPNSLIVRWRTSLPTDSRVRYGTAPLSLSSATGTLGPTTEHAVLVDGLSPDTRYYYSVGNATGALAGATDSFFFVTSPIAGVAKPTRIWVLGDSGTATFSAEWVRDAFYDFNQGPRPDLWLMLGDNAYPAGTDAQYQRAVFDMYPETLRSSVLWPTLGNHDGYSSFSDTQSGPYYDMFSLPKNGEAGGLPSETEAYYSFDYGSLHLICLDSFHADRSATGEMMSWLGEDLAATTQEWILAFWHHPPYSKGSHDSDFERELIDMRENALPILEEGGVDLVLCGHSHSYERSYLLDNHYGDSESLTDESVLDSGDGRVGGDGPYRKPPGKNPHRGAVYAVCGSSGKVSPGSFDHPVMYFSLPALGSMVLDVQEARLDAGFLDTHGTLQDVFSIEKSASSPSGSIWRIY